MLMPSDSYPETRQKKTEQGAVQKAVGLLEAGIANIKEENFEEAVEDLKKARSMEPSSSIAAYYLGIAYKKTQDFANAELNLTDALKLAPKIKKAAIELADVLHQLGKDKEAIEALAEAEEIEPANTAFLKGLALAGLGSFDEAVESFEKSKALDEGLRRTADFQIASVRLKQGRLKEAENAFREIVLKDPNADIAQFAKQYAEDISKRIKEGRPYNITAGLQYVFDSNVILKPTDSTVAGDITDESDSGAVVTLRGEYTPELNGPVRLKAQYSLYNLKYFDLSTHDVQSHTFSAVPYYNLANGLLSLVGSYNYTLVSGSGYVHGLTLSPTYQFTVKERNMIQASVRFAAKDYIKAPLTDDEDRDSTEAGIDLSWHYFLTQNRGFLTASLGYASSSAQGVNWGYTGARMSVGVFYPLKERLNLNAGIEANLQDFADTHTAFNVKRADETYSLNALLSYNLLENLDLLAQTSYTAGNSNIAVYEYNKYTISTGIDYRF
ncbi:MAG: tetratricopeptide repeat protein [Deltaproteobacteria bacterium]